MEVNGILLVLLTALEIQQQLVFPAPDPRHHQRQERKCVYWQFVCTVPLMRKMLLFPVLYVGQI